ncbi:MAG: DNA gyrase inhibitor YacG [Planctomycetia bacterium]|nr:DNA gyrase inhibitor YacG [Planctomycetia bacterium]MCI0702947.1 DNA gyrase inhibitor YacG [Planctomycetia bacterium]
MSKVQCPICSAAMAGSWQEYPDYPFCSARCRKIDLGRWLKQEYRVPAPAPPDDRSTPGEGEAN